LHFLEVFMFLALRSRIGIWADDGRLYAVLAACGFAMKAVFVKLAYAAGPVEPLTLLALRMAFALPLFLWLIHASGGPGTPALSRADAAKVWLLACLGYYLSSLFDFYGLVYISAGLERLILYLYPTFVLLIQAWLARRRPGGAVWRALAICYAGLAITFAHDLQQAGGGANVAIGSAWVFGCAITYALYYLGTGDLVKRIGAMRLAGLSGSASCVLVLAHYLLVGQPAQLPDLPGMVFGHAAMMAAFSTVLPVWWLALAIARLGAGQAAAVGTMGPVLTVAAAWLLLGEPLSVLQIGGLALVMLGVARIKPSAA
jgi:drug/metabolite transporter (DMT)-like permease